MSTPLMLALQMRREWAYEDQSVVLLVSVLGIVATADLVWTMGPVTDDPGIGGAGAATVAGLVLSSGCCTKHWLSS